MTKHPKNAITMAPPSTWEKGGVPCPQCGNDSSWCRNSRPGAAYGHNATVRRRECKRCRAKFNTAELSEEQFNLLLSFDPRKVAQAIDELSSALENVPRYNPWTGEPEG